MSITAPRGTADILPSDILKWKYIEGKISEICDKFGFEEIRTPIFENTELFERGVGDTTDVVQKEMYTFNDKGGRSITLRPEGTACVARAFLEHNIYSKPLPAKLFYLISCYRYEKPQAGRLREFHQFGAECFGSQSPAVDGEIITLAHTVLTELGIDDVTLNINSIGCPECRKKYNEALKDYFRPHIESGELCETCRGRFDKNPLRILDCKSPVCGKIAESAPVLLDYICDECADHFEKVKGYLDAVGINYVIDGTIVRGLDYYTKTVFEFKTSLGGAAGTVCGGGRYDGLIEELGGAPTPAIGFAMGIERIILALTDNGKMPDFESIPDVYVANIGDESDFYATVLVNKLRKAGLKAERDLCARSLKAQMKYANKIGAKYSIVIGEDEAKSNSAILKNMNIKTEISVSLENADDILKAVMEEK
ncbi:MAG: histidine--tRNA ligase [Clostridia bacterium]|nr:histidine--tRNA ligase [Clostridia bacterium]